MENIKESKFKLGDRVIIIKYGSKAWVHPNEYNYEEMMRTYPGGKSIGNAYYFDPTPEEVGKIGIVSNVTETQGRFQYSLAKTGKRSWFNEDQLEHKMT